MVLIVATPAMGVNVALYKPVTGSSYYDSGSEVFPFDNVTDGRLNDTGSPWDWSFWLTPNATTGYVVVDLENTYDIEMFRVQNTHNRGHNDRATANFSIYVSTDGVDFGSAVVSGTMATVWGASPIPFEEYLVSSVRGRYVRFNIDSYYGSSGGINELEVIVVDTDGDDIADEDDNCPEVSNPSQEDLDVNGVGDVCETNVNAYIRGTGGDPGEGLPSWDPILHIYEDKIHIENKSAGQAILLPMAAVLQTLAPASVSGDNTDNEAHSSGLPPDACWVYIESSSEGTVGDLSDGTLDPGERISRVWQFHDPLEVPFTFFADVVAAGLPSKRSWGEESHVEGRAFFHGTGIAHSWKTAWIESIGPKAFAADEPLLYDQAQMPMSLMTDDGTPELFIDTVDGGLICANRFDLSKRREPREVSFYIGAPAVGSRVDLILYFDPLGRAAVPDTALEVYRKQLEIEEEGFQKVMIPRGTLFVRGKRRGTLFVGVENLPGAKLSLGVDQSSMIRGNGAYSVDGGRTFRQQAACPVMDGNFMIRLQ